MNTLSIFSGCGGLDIAAEMAGITILLQCEIDENCQTILSRHWPDVKKWKDVKTLDADAIINEFGQIDLIFGGPPCQPVSVAGRREAAGDERNMWPPFLDLIRGIRPRWVVAENPTGVLSAPYKKDEPKGTFFGSILRQMDEMGYVCGWGVWGACDVEHDEEGAPLPLQSAGCAPHQRERVFIVAHRDSRGCKQVGKPDMGQSMGERRSAAYMSSKVADSGFVAYADSEWQLQPRGTVGNIGGRACDGGDVAYAPCAEQDRPVTDGDTARRGGFADSGDVGHACRAGREERNPPALSSEQGHATGECACGYVGNAQRSRCNRQSRRRAGSEPADGYDHKGDGVECGLGGVPTGLTYRMDGDLNYVKQKRISKARIKISESAMRKMRRNRQIASPSHEWKYKRQSTVESNDIVHILSCEMALEEWKENAEKTIGMHNLWRSCKEAGYVPKTLSEIYAIWRSLSHETKNKWIISANRGSPYSRWIYRWPSGRGAEQYDWEPPRVIPGGGKGRGARLKMLGNMVMPYQARLLFEEIVRAEAYRRET